MAPILKYILKTAVRDWLYVGLFAILIAAFGASALLGSTAIVEKLSMTIIYMAGSSRMIFAIGMILFTCFYVHRSFDNKEVEFILSKSISRHKFILSYLLGFIFVALLILIPIIITLFLIGANKIGLFYWSLNIFFEILIIITFSILASLILRSAVSAVLASLGFYILSRAMGFFILTISIPTQASDVASFERIMNSFLKVLSFIFPRLDLFTQSKWLIYGVQAGSNMTLILTQSAIYIPLLVFMSFYDFSKKQF